MSDSASVPESAEWVWADVRAGLRLFGAIAFRAAPGAVSARILSVVLAPLVSAATVLAFQAVVDAIPAADLAAAKVAIVMFVGAAVLGVLAGQLDAYAQTTLIQEFDVAMDRASLERICGIPLATVEDPEFRLLLDRYRRKSSDVANVMLRGIEGAESLLSAIGSAVILLRVPWSISAVLAGASLMHLFIGRRAAVLHWSHYLRETRDGRRAIQRWAALIEPKGFVALRGVDAERSYFADWCAASGRTLDARRADARVGRRYRIVSRFVDLVAMVAILGLLWIALRDGRATGGAIVAFLVAYQRLIGDLNQMMAEWHAVQRALPSLGIIRKLLELPQEPEDGLPIPDGPVEIRLEDVCFRYPGAERDVLSHIDFVVRPGEHLALVGRNGSGKSTLAKLVTGMYRPTSGRILVNGVDVALVRPRDLRRLLSILPQEDRIFEGTVRELIALGDAERPFDPLRFARAVHVSGFAGVMEKLPLGDMTVIGREFSLPEDDATTLSGGEAQLLGLSRALYRDVPVYWLDEPTSKVDAERQEAFFSRIFAAMEGRTLVFVSHLFGSVRRAPRVVVLDGGRLVEDGDPCELLRCGGVYAELFRSQA